MKKNGKHIAVILGLAIGAAMPAAAQAQATGRGVYVGVGAGQAEALEYECDLLPTCKKKGTAYKFFSGLQFHRHFAVEVAFTDFGQVSSSAGAAFDEIIKVKASEVTLVALYHPTERFSFFGKVGGYYANTSDQFTQSGVTRTVKETNGNGTFGAGLQWFFWNGFALRGEGQRYMKVGGGNIGDSDYNVYTLSVLWKFK
ncbi:MAG TPA: outer membrane beta-barrel protein [Burkholderiales bacterium]|nr:outer membrane beta-barrel protein [Burkholderiales bacterium]